MRVKNNGVYLGLLLIMITQPLLAQNFSPANEQGQLRYWVKFGDDGLIQRLGGHAAFNQGVTSRSARFASEQATMQQEQAVMLQAIASELGHDLQISHHFLVTKNAVGALLTADEAARVANMPGVVSVARERTYQLDDYRGPDFIGADTIWNGSATPDGSSLLGEDMIAGILDSGVNTDHPSFSNVTACGHGIGGATDKLISAVDCSTADVAGRCNGPLEEDTNGHGTHTASTVAGNTIDNSTVPSPNIPAPFTTMSGVAPCAHVRIYKVCPGQSCPGFDIAAGMETLLQDGDVDTMNYSISGGTSPWIDFDRTKLDIIASGVFVAASAGNTSAGVPDPVGQVNHRGPWVTSVAASTHDVVTGNPVSLTGGPTEALAVEGTGPAMTVDFNGPLRYAGDVDAANFEGCVAFPAGAFSGEAALISRGACNFSAKVDNAVAAGATYVIVYNNVPGGAIIMGGLETTTVSSVMVDNTIGQAMIATLSGGTAQVTVGAEVETTINPPAGDVLANFSLRGPTPGPLQDLQKPDITAPGVNIYAAVSDPANFGFLSGTSMSGPHVAGAATLIRQAQPDWTPIEVKSAIMMTAVKDGTKDDFSGPWDWDDVGSGRVDLTKAALAGLVMDETFTNFVNADPATGGDVKTLNLAAVRDVSCLTGCNWTRTVQSGQDFATSWSVNENVITGGLTIEATPSSFSLLPRSSDVLFIDDAEDSAPGTAVSVKQPINITVTGVSVGSGITFGTVDFTEAGDLTPPAHITVAVGDQ